MIRRFTPQPRVKDLRQALQTPRTRMWAFIIATGLLTSIALLLSPPAVVTYDVGAVATQDVKAPRSISFVSDSLTAAERDAILGGNAARIFHIDCGCGASG